MNKTLTMEKLKSFFRRYRENINILSILISLIFGCLNAFGRHMYFDHNLPDDRSGWLAMIGEIALYSVLMWILIPIIETISEYLLSANLLKKRVNSKETKHPHLFFIIAAVVIFGCWLPWIIAFNPCSAEWDTYKPIMGYMGYWPLDNAAPRLYISIVGYFYKQGVLWGNKEAGLFLFILFRDIIHSLIFAYISNTVFKKVNKIAGILVLLFFAITPVWGAYAKHLFKDTSYLALFSWYITETVLTVKEIRHKQLTSWRCVLYSLSGLMTALFRYNGIYVIIPATILLCVGILKYVKQWSKVVLVMIGIITFMGYQNYANGLLDKQGSNSTALFIIPFQQVARTMAEHESELTEEEIECIRGVQNYGDLGSRYNMLLADPVLAEFRDGESAGKYIRNWFSMLWKYPQTYIEAFVGQNYGYYAFTPREAYGAGNFNSGMTLWHWVKDGRFPPEITCDYVYPDLNDMRNSLAGWADLWDTIPVINLTYSMPFYTWLTVLATYYCIKRKKLIYCIPMLAMILMILTCVASPVNGCFRYYCGVAAAFPGLCLLAAKN